MIISMKKNLFALRGLSICALAASLVAALPAWAADPFTLRDIRLQGLQRVEPGTVFASLPFRIGEQYNDEKGAQAIRALFSLELFSDVRLQIDTDVLVVIVEERPSIAELSFTGIKEFNADVLKKALRDVGLTESRPFDKALANQAEQELKRQYINRSMYAAEVVTTATPIDRNRVNLNFSVVEGNVATINEIRIVGNHAFSESTLRNLFDLDTSGVLTWYTKSDRYSRVKLNADLENLRSYYLTRGFLEFKIDSTQVAISPDKNTMSVTINITEGKRYAVSSIELEGDYLGREEEFKSLVQMRVGEPYNIEDVSKTTKAFTDYFGTFGYAFARVEALPEIDKLTNQVTFVLRADPSKRVYVRRINIEGNTSTRDEVIRREFRQLEAAWYDGDKIRLSRDRVDRLGYFSEVNIDTQAVPGTIDQVDLTISVAEKPSGSFSLGTTYSQADKFSFVLGYKYDNVFGTGNYLGFDLNTGKYNRQFVLSSVNPYFTQDGISRGFDLYYRSTTPYSAQGGDYSLVTPGASVRFGIPFSENDTVFFGIGAEQTRIKSGNGLSQAYQEYADKFGANSVSVPLTVGWSRDSRDSALVPNQGRLQSVNTELGVAGDTRYAKVNYQFQQYIPLNKQYTFAVNAEIGYGTGLSSRPYPVFKNFYGGGLGSVRGFSQGTLGPLSGIVGSNQLVNIGGSKNLVFNTEFITPFPGAGNDRTLRLFGFLDAGNVYGPNEKMSGKNLRASVGIGLSWIAPALGPLRFSYAVPIRKQPQDKIQKFQFQVGTSF